MTDKAIYRSLCLSARMIPVFANDWWLDAVCGKDGWDVAIVEKGGQVIAAWPYYQISTRFFKHIAMPKLTPYMGPWIKYPKNQKLVTRLGHEKEMFTTLIEKISHVDVFRQQISPEITNWLPWYWMGFHIRPQITYAFDDLSDIDAIWHGMKENIKTDIRKAEKTISVLESEDILEFYKLIKLTYDRQGKRPPFSEEDFRVVDKAVRGHGACTLLFAEDVNGRKHAGIYLVRDMKTTYYLIGGADPALRNSGAGSMLIWWGIQMAAAHNTGFDFEGSIIPSIEKVFRAFGASQKQYFSIMRESLSYQIINGFRKQYELIKRLIRHPHANS